MFKNAWSCSNVRSFFQPLVEKCLCEKWSCSNVQKSLVGLVPMFDPFSSRLIAISSVFSPFVPHFSERHARPIGKTNKPKIFKHFAKDFLSTPRTASSKSLFEKSFANCLVYLVCEVRMMWFDMMIIELSRFDQLNKTLGFLNKVLRWIFCTLYVRWGGLE